MEWGFKRHLEIYAGSQRFADESSWDCTIHPAIDRALNSKGPPAFDGIIARATSSIAAAAAKARIPVVNVWLNSPVTHLPGVYPDFRASGTMAAEHLLGRGFRNFGHLGFLRDIDAREQHSGFHEALTEAGFTCESYRFPRSGTEGKARGWEQFISGLESWMDSWTPPVGILVCNDQYARYLIADNSHTRIEVKNVVTAVATNRRSLERKFRSILGQSISNEITRLRLDRAKRRMVETDTPMKEIALDSGFRDADHLYKVFQRVIGIPPTRFREEHQKLFHSKQS